ncbi:MULTISPECIES: APC family permease [Mesonia]|uniref:Inner membrane transport protein YbaT n=1 Tax=Mesonia oceanica TaxID=2687242 RepID=A0AC61Y667_9FLAO|nr:MULTISPECIES: APC family permease [Mesonia]MAN29501.1 amino acid permease [Mesonia sp.]MAQ41637.1 amino acid permease [Mesonia sp.]MBJ98732.1 amino acid permease [Flavobacteriaceae bacterium]VVU99377.1 Inner membrane transport protein YbaT [Mesonia oceanica]|tara:strand:- start:3098 stop:4453 length:1356 start_codon:yes stop_codon:yes gene_type:complete
MKVNTTNIQKLSLIGSISLGTGVMIGAGIFVLMGQIAELVGDLFPIAFIAGAIVVGFSSYSYVKFSNAFPSSGGVVKFLDKSYGPGTTTGVFSLLMYVSMVISESLVAGTFGAYTLRLFPEDFAGYASILGIVLLVTAYIVNVLGNKVIGATATFTAIIKVVGIALLAIAGLIVSGFSDITGNYIPQNTETLPQGFAFVAALALSILAYKGFTTITNQGGDIKNPHKNLGRSIIISILICTLIYVALALAVAGGLSIPEVIAAKDYALAAAARPIFGEWGSWITIGIAIIATVSGVIASVFSSSRLLAMLSNMKQVPSLKRMGNFKNPALIFTVSLAILLTVLFDLTRIASIGAIFYLIMDIAIHWGLVRHLKKEVDFKPIIPLVAIILDVAVLTAFLYIKYLNDPLVLIVAAIGIVLIIVAERLFMISHTDDEGNMHMGMETTSNKHNKS